LDREAAEALDPREERTPVVRSKFLNIVLERIRGGPGPEANQNGNGAPQLPPVGGGSTNQNQNQQPSPGSDPSAPPPGVLSFDQARQQQQQQPLDDNWAKPPPHPSDRRALTPITERSTRDSNSLDTGTNPPPLQRPGLSVVNGSPPQSDQIQKQQSETSQDLPKLQTDTESSTFLGEALVTSPTSHIPLRGFDLGRTDLVGSLGSKLDSHRLGQESASLSRPDSKLDTHASMDAIRPAGGSITSPLSSPGRESVFSTLPSPYSNQPIHPVQSTFSDIPGTIAKSPDRPVTPPTRKGAGVEPGPGSPTPSSPSRFQGATQRREAGSPSNSLTAAKKAKMLEPTSLSQNDPRPNSPTISPTPTTVNSPPTLTHTGTTTSTASRSEYSGYSGGVRPSPPQQIPGTFSSPNHSNQGSYSQPHSYSTSRSQLTMQGDPFQKEPLSTSFSGKPEVAKPVTRAGGGKEGSGDDHDLTREAGALYYMQEIQGASAVPPPKIIGRGKNIPVSSTGRSDTDDEGEGEEPSTEDEPRPQQWIPPEPSPLQVRRPSAQVKASIVPPPSHPLPASPPQHPAHPPPYPSQNQHQDLGYAQDHDRRPIFAPQPQQLAASSFNPIKTIEGEPPNLPSPGSDTNPTSSVVDSRRTSVIGSGGGHGGGSRPGLVSRPSGARDLVSRQRGGTSDSISSHPRHNSQPQPRQPLPPHPESFAEQPSQFPYSTYARPPHHQGQNFTQAQGDTAQTLQPIGTAGRHSTNMANVDQHHHYDNSDALAALTFLDRDEANAASKSPPRPPQERGVPTSGMESGAYDTPPVHVTPSDSRDDVSQDSGSYEGKYKSSFAPSKQATQRLAKSQAQQAAHQAAVHRPGKSGGTNGKGKRKVHQDSWAESSDEEEEDEDDDDEDVDSDGDPVAPRRGQGPGVGSGQNFGKLSAQGSPYGSTTDLNQLGQGRPQRHLPRPPSPGRGYGMCFPPDAPVS
jgi:CCR4-NOT transcriptional complex subunit CAF120